MIALAVFLAVLTIFAAGSGLTLALWKRAQPILAAEFFAFSWLLGAGVISALIALGSIVFSGAALFAMVAAVAFLLGVHAVRRRRAGVRIDWGFEHTPRWERWFSVLALLPVLYMAAFAMRDSLLWDGLVIWEAKARHAFLAGGALPAEYFSDSTRVNYHPSYPLFLPYTELWVYLWIGDANQTAIKAIFPIFYAAGIALLWSYLLRFTGRLWVAALTSLLPLFVPSMADGGHGLLKGYADSILGSVYLGGVGGLLVWRYRGITGGWPIAVACAALLPWIKQEGLLLLASLILLAALIHGWRGRRRTVLFALPGLFVVVAWRAALHAVDAVEAATFQALNLENLLANLPRLGPILKAMGEELALLRNWSLLWFGTSTALICLFLRRRPETLWLALALAVPLALDIVPYLFTTLNLRFHLGTSLDRLILQVSLVAVLCLGLALDDTRKLPPPDPR